MDKMLNKSSVGDDETIPLLFFFFFLAAVPSVPAASEPFVTPSACPLLCPFVPLISASPKGFVSHSKHLEALKKAFEL